jgi:hypothetical protein
MQVVQDPGGTTPGITGRLCFVHNRLNPSDKTAQHAYDLWHAMVSYDIDAPIEPYIKNHYWTNAILHGADKKNQPQLREPPVMEFARGCCTRLLKGQINFLSPRIIISNGEVAAKSLFDIGLISATWKEITRNFTQIVYKESNKLIPGQDILFFVLTIRLVKS